LYLSGFGSAYTINNTNSANSANSATSNASSNNPNDSSAYTSKCTTYS
jgi:hypothetical protein